MKKIKLNPATTKLYIGGSYFVYLVIYNFWQLYQSWMIRNEDPGASEIQNIIISQIFCYLLVVSLFVYARLKLISNIDLKILKFSQKFYSEETAKLCFEPLIADWKKEHSESISQNENWNAIIISIRYSYAFLSAMFMQSKIGRLLQIIFKS